VGVGTCHKNNQLVKDDGLGRGGGVVLAVVHCFVFFAGGLGVAVLFAFVAEF
jgi:hypothetical protein